MLEPRAAARCSSTRREFLKIVLRYTLIRFGGMIGVLLARIISGLIASAAGWRAVYVVAAAIILLLAAAMYRALPETGPGAAISYGALICVPSRAEPAELSAVRVGDLRERLAAPQ